MPSGERRHPISQQYFADFHHSSDDHPITVIGSSRFSAGPGTASRVCSSRKGTVQLFGSDLAAAGG